MKNRVRECMNCGAEIWPETEKTWEDERGRSVCDQRANNGTEKPHLLHRPDPGEDIDAAMAIYGN